MDIKNLPTSANTDFPTVVIEKENKKWANIKTVNSQSLLGSGNLLISEYTAGNGIDITSNTISNTITSYNDLTDLPTIPTSTSDLSNDSGFAYTGEENIFTDNQQVVGDLTVVGNTYLNGDNNANQFSETEILNGKWIDGSDLYRCTYQTTLANNDVVSITTDLTSEVVVNIIGACNNGITVYPINYSNGDNISTYYDSGIIYISTDFDGTGYTAFVTLEYIK